MAQELFGSGAEGVGFPASAEHMGELLGLEMGRGVGGELERVETKACYGVKGLEDCDSVKDVGGSKGETVGEIGDQAVGKVAVDIEEGKARALLDVLADEVLEEVALADAGEADDGKMGGTVFLREKDGIGSGRAIGNAQEKVVPGGAMRLLGSAEALEGLSEPSIHRRVVTE